MLERWKHLQSGIVWRLVLGGITLSVIALTAVRGAASASEPIVELTQAARRVASGDLSQHVTTAGRDEVGELAQAFNKMIAYLRGMYSRGTANVAWRRAWTVM